MKQVPLNDFLKFPSPVLKNRKLVNIRGCNGAGKSTVPLSMIASDPLTFELTWEIDGKIKPIATVCPKFKFAFIGYYHSKTGGMDILSSTQIIKDATRKLWNTNYHILMEGIIASTVRQTYIDLFTDLSRELGNREVIIYNILPPLEVCLQRIQERNGGKLIKEKLVEDKWRTVMRNAEHFKNAGFKSLILDNSVITKEQTLDWFFENIGMPYKTFHFSGYKPLLKDPPPIAKIPYIEPAENLVHYDWYEDYKDPNPSLEIDQKFMDSYWNFIAERMNIWYKRVILGEPAPWTDDPILKEYKFTNVIRDLDKLSIWERRHILAKLDEPVDDFELRKKSVLLNIMIFRLWVKIDTYLVHGFIDLGNSNWKQDWETAKQNLLKRREDGISNFTAAYYVNDLRAVNPDPATRGNKTQNAICMIESWMSNIDEIYENAIVKAKNMKEQLAYFTTLPCVGDFTAYEYACSLAETKRYCRNPLVKWTQDNATNVGPGALRGIDWIFKDRGGMTPYQCILYLRSIWKHELQKRGTYDRFVSQLPKEMNGDIDLRVIEHCLCETQKYNKAWTGSGRPKETFKVKTENLEELK